MMEIRFLTTSIALVTSAALAACGGTSKPGTTPVIAPAAGSASTGSAEAPAGSAASTATPAAGSAVPADPCAGG